MPQLFPPPNPIRPSIVVHQSSEPEEHYSIRTDGKNIIITGGGKRGAMYGCYAFLQDVLGCRWYTRSVSFIPHKPTLTVGPLNLHGGPAFEYREPYFTEAFDRD